MRTLVVEGWRSFPQSLSIINQFQCLELLKRPDIRLFHRDMPSPPPTVLLARRKWEEESGLLPPDAEEAVRSIPGPPRSATPDVTYRIYFPYDFSSAPKGRTVVFCVTEYGVQQKALTVGGLSLKDALKGSDAVIVTPSQWSRKGLINSGAEPERVVVVPHGVDPSIYRPLLDSERAALRRSLGWEGRFVVLAVGGMYPRKGVRSLLKALAAIAAKHPQVRLFLKGTETIYRSREALRSIGRTLAPAEIALVRPRLKYVGATASFADMARIYQAADLFASPYHAEGFNLPVLEAIACGLPVVCTGGGPTDDFTREEFALRIESSVKPVPGRSGIFLQPDLDHLVALMSKAVEDEAFAARARKLGPKHVMANYTWRHVTERLMKVLDLT